MSERKLVRRRGSFSDRNGLSPISKAIQTKKFCKETRIVLKNRIIDIIERHQKSRNESYFSFEPYFAKRLSIELFNLPLNTEESNYDNVIRLLYEVFDEGTYLDILDTIEFFANEVKVRDFYAEACGRLSYGDKSVKFCDLKKEFNAVFEAECLGYRFVGDYILEITSEEEITSIEDASNTRYEKVNKHIHNAIELISSRSHRDYKGAIAECSQGLECLLNSLLHTNGLTLGEAIKTYGKNNARMHPALVKSLADFYGYASDAAGIRHDANNRDFEEGYEEAKMILVNTSSFVNYLITTADTSEAEDQ